MLNKVRHLRKEGTYKLVALCGLVCTAVVFGIMMVGGLVLQGIATLGHRLST
jgi:hypothetical protein